MSGTKDIFNDKVKQYRQARQFQCSEAEAIRACIAEFPELYEAELAAQKEADQAEGREHRHSRIKKEK